SEESLVPGGESGRFDKQVKNPTTAPTGRSRGTGTRSERPGAPDRVDRTRRTGSGGRDQEGTGLPDGGTASLEETREGPPISPRRVETMGLPRKRTPRGSKRRQVARWSALALGVILPSVGCQVEYGGMTLPSGRYMHDDVQYFPSGPDFPWANTQPATRRASVAA